LPISSRIETETERQNVSKLTYGLTDAEYKAALAEYRSLNWCMGNTTFAEFIRPALVAKTKAEGRS
jgi:hypothetical protein